MFEKSGQSKVTILGKEFASDEERREFFRSELRKRLPELKKMEGFPLGTDDDIIALSDPPYYTACPNPWIADFVNEWEAEKPAKPKDWHYSREPFAADVSEGKNDPIYNAHVYHTKVPYKAIMRYILHYTEPGDVVLDGFCGSGMTGVAAQLCRARDVVLSLGYQVRPDGSILREDVDIDGKRVWVPFSKLGARHAVLNDLSPAATFLACNYNTPVDVEAFQREARRILDEVQNECGWMYATKHSDGRAGTINYTVWSNVFVCPACGGEVVFWDAAFDRKSGKVRDEFVCPHCDAKLTKRSMENAWTTRYDKAIDQIAHQVKQVPVLINYTIDRKHFEKEPEDADLAVIERIQNTDIPYPFPTEKFMFKGEHWGDTWRAGVHAGITNVHHFYTKRNLWVMAALRQRVRSLQFLPLHYWLDSLEHGLGRRVKHGDWSFPMSVVSGTLYLPSLSRENNPLYFYSTKYKKQAGVLAAISSRGECTTTQSAEFTATRACSTDYLFVDPPFGDNLMYSELNFLWESWLRVWTNNKPEAIENKAQGKGVDEYRELMLRCFREHYRVLKPGRWMTVEFSNTQASVWNAIQSAIQQAGFVIANVAALDKQQLSFKAVTTPTAVKQDLVGTEKGIWEFVHMQLDHLPVMSVSGAVLHRVEERTPRSLYDRLVAYYVAHGAHVPMDSADFQQQARDRFPERDDMLFLDNQVAMYDKAKLRADRVETEELFVSNEATAIGWLRRELGHERQTYSDIVGPYMKVAQSIAKHERIPELKVLLEQNFLQDDKGQWYVPDPHKESDLQKLRDRALLKDFEQYRQEILSGQKKLKDFRIEAMRAGFRQCWDDRAYGTIILVAEHLPTQVVEEDPTLLMYYDNAQTMKGK
jgi:16S rRNA G966 N2-methylase RsmD/predicted RNA-binding Zn-ribbon protein involved in translation (DUF1610 family)